LKKLENGKVAVVLAESDESLKESSGKPKVYFASGSSAQDVHFVLPISCSRC